MSHKGKYMGISLAIVAVALTAVVAVADVTLDFMFQDMDPHIGQAFFLRVVDLNTFEEVTRLSIDEIPTGAFDIEVPGLVAGDPYRVDFFVDFNGNGSYDAPPVDHAWRIDLPAVQMDGSLPVIHNTMFTDIGWPPAIDGTIEEMEYNNMMLDEATGMTVYWTNDKATLFVGLISPGLGYLSIGFEPERQMQGANIIIASIDGETLKIEDHYGNAPTSHRKDETDNIIQASGSESDGVSYLEFAIPLDSGDEQDKALEAGADVVIILAYHRSNDGLTARHSKRSVASILLDE